MRKSSSVLLNVGDNAGVLYAAEPLETRTLLSTFGVTSTADSGTGSLREAINLANSNQGPDSISFTGRQFQNLFPDTITLTSGELEIIGDLTIFGTGQNLLKIDAVGLSRVFHIRTQFIGFEPTVQINDLTIARGSVAGDFGGSRGGGIWLEHAGTLTLTNVTLDGNSADDGGAISFGSPLTLVNCSIIGNTANDDGGGILGTSTLSVSNTTISNNTAAKFGGGILLNFDAATITGSVISGNTASNLGAGIFNDGTLTLTTSTIADNHGSSGIWNHFNGNTTILRTTISGNSAGGAFNKGTLKISDSTISNNYAGGGGGIKNDGTLAVSNSTISSNSAGAAGGGLSIGPGSSATLTNVTITNNRADSDNNGAAPEGGGIFVSQTGIVTAFNSIISGNLGTNGNADDAVGPLGGSFNFIGGLARLGPLTDNGGPTKTHSLFPGSPAIDFGSNQLALDVNGNPLASDQRGAGFPRIQGSAVDLGAFESKPFVGSLIVTTVVDEDDGNSDPLLGTGTSLREAIAYAKSHPGDDTITFSSIFFPANALTTIKLNTQLVIDDLTATTNILGLGADRIALSGNNSHRVLLLVPAITANISDLTITEGAVGNIFQTDFGGGIWNNFNANLTLTNVRVSNSTARSLGGGIYNAGTLTLNNSSVLGNSTDSSSDPGGNTSAGKGGGIYNAAGGTAALINSTVSSNAAHGVEFGGGGGIYNESILTLIGSTVSSNSSNHDGGGIENHGSTTITRSTISGNTARVFGGGIFNFSTLQIDDSSISNNSAGDDGGGIFTRRALTMTNSAVSGNTVKGRGGGVYYIAPNQFTSISLTGCTISGNLAKSGAGIYNDAGTAKITSSVLSLNVASDSGGAIYNNSDNSSSPVTVGKLTLTSSILSANVAASSGGGLFNAPDGTTTIANGTFSGNTSNFNGGAISNSATLNIDSTTISGNSAFQAGGGILNLEKLSLSKSSISNNHASRGGGIANDIGMTTINGSTLAGNTVSAFGGGIWNRQALIVTNSTVSGNFADADGGGLFNEPGSAASLTNATITNNRADANNNSVGAGGGLFNSPTAIAMANNTILSGNFGALSNTDDLNGIVAGTFNLIGGNAILGPLASNLGPTQTHTLLAGSPAIDAGSNQLALDANGNPLLTDQRGPGFDRIQGLSVDIGAFESEPPKIPALDLCGPKNLLTDGNDMLSLVVASSRVFAWVNHDPAVDPPDQSSLQSAIGTLSICTQLGNDSVTIDYRGGPIGVPITIDGSKEDDSIRLINQNAPAGMQSTAIDSVTLTKGTLTFLSDGLGLDLSVQGAARVNFDGNQHLFALRLGKLSNSKILPNGNRFLRCTVLQMAADAILDLGDNDMIIDSTPAARQAMLATVSQSIKSGRNGGMWNANGIRSSAAAAEPNKLTGLAIVLNDNGNGSILYPTFDADPIDVNSILVKYTWNGDADLSGKVDADDYFQIDNGFAQKLAGYRNGDFDFNGSVDADDYFLIDRAFVGQGSVLGEDPHPALSQSTGRGNNLAALVRHRRGGHHHRRSGGR